jgi:hypothetical protein
MTNLPAPNANGIVEIKGQFVTNDLSFTAYLMMHGCQLIDAKRLGKTYKFILDLGDRNAEKLKIEYVNSESAHFDSSVRDLKKIIFSVQET